MLDGSIAKVRGVVRLSLGLDDDAFVDDLRMITCEKWDSLVQVNIVLGIESEFNISLNTDEMSMLTSFESIRLLLKKKGVM
jgi:acyl carrier protein